VRARGGGLWRISDLHPAYDPLHFVLFHPHGEPGWQPGMPHAIVAPVRRRATGGEEEGDAGHVVADAEPTQLAQDDGNKEEGDVKHVVADAGPAQPAQCKKISAWEWAWYHMHDRNPTSHALFVYGKRLYQEWGVDQYSKVESQRLFYIRNNQGRLRASFIGGHRHMA